MPRLRNPSTGTVVLLLAAAGAAAYWYFGKDKKEKGKPLPSSTPKPGTVMVLPKIPGFMPDAPFVLLIYADTMGGQAQFDEFQMVGKSVKVPLYAVKVPATDEYNSVLIAERKNGAWLETISGEDENDWRNNPATETRLLMDWAAGAGDLQLEKALWLGEHDAVWKGGAPGVPPIPIDLQLGAIYTFPINPPDPAASINVSSSDEEAAPALVYEEDGKHFINVFPEKEKAVKISVQQGDWVRSMTVKGEAFE